MYVAKIGYQIGHHAQVILYSVQCCYALHWTDKNSTKARKTKFWYL